MQAMTNSVDWAEMYLVDRNRKPWRANSYQREILLNTDKIKKVYMPRGSGKTEMIIIDAIYNMLTKPNAKIGIITYGYARSIWEALSSKLRRHPEIEARIEAMVNSTMKLEATNDSTIQCWTAEGVGWRGQDLDYLYIDEANLIQANKISILERQATNVMFVYTRNE